MVATEYRVKWCNHSVHVFSQLSHLLEHETLLDVTLMCNENSLKVHRLMLAACSPYFEHVLQQELGHHPLIVLKDMQFTVLRSIIEFMYYGETCVSEDNIDSLIEAAKFFEIKGLSEMSIPKNGNKKKANPFTKDNICIVSGFSTGNIKIINNASIMRNSSPASIHSSDSAFEKVSTSRTTGRKKNVNGNCVKSSGGRQNSQSSSSLTTIDLSSAGSSFATAINDSSACTIEPVQQRMLFSSTRTDSPSSLDNLYPQHNRRRRVNNSSTLINNNNNNNNNNVVTIVNEDLCREANCEETANIDEIDSLDDNNSPSTVGCEPSDSGYKSDSVSSSLDSFTNPSASSNTASSSGSESPAFKIIANGSGTCSPLKHSPVPRIDSTSFYNNFRNLFKSINAVNDDITNNKHKDATNKNDTDVDPTTCTTTEDSPLLASLLTRRSSNSSGKDKKTSINNKRTTSVNISRGILTVDGDIRKPNCIESSSSANDLKTEQDVTTNSKRRRHRHHQQQQPFIVDVDGSSIESSLSWDDSSIFVVDDRGKTSLNNSLDLVESFDLNDAEVISLTNEMHKHLTNASVANSTVCVELNKVPTICNNNNNNNNNRNDGRLFTGFQTIESTANREKLADNVVIVTDDGGSDDVKNDSSEKLINERERSPKIITTDELSTCTVEDPDAVVLFRENAEGKLEKYVISSGEIENLKLMNREFRNKRRIEENDNDASRIRVSAVIGNATNELDNNESGSFTRVIDYKCSPTRTVDNILFGKLPFRKVFEDDSEEKRITIEDVNNKDPTEEEEEEVVLDRPLSENILDELDNNRFLGVEDDDDDNNIDNIIDNSIDIVGDNSLEVEFETCELKSIAMTALDDDSCNDVDCSNPCDNSYFTTEDVDSLLEKSGIIDDAGTLSIDGEKLLERCSSSSSSNNKEDDTVTPMVHDLFDDRCENLLLNCDSYRVLLNGKDNVETISKSIEDHMLDHTYLLLPTNCDDLDGENPTIESISNSSSPSSHIRRCHNPFESDVQDDDILSNDVLMANDLISLTTDIVGSVKNKVENDEDSSLDSLARLMNSSISCDDDDVFSFSSSVNINNNRNNRNSYDDPLYDDNPKSYDLDDDPLYNNSKYDFNWLVGSSSSCSPASFSPSQSSSISIKRKRRDLDIFDDDHRKKSKSIDDRIMLDFDDHEIASCNLIEEIVYDELQSVT